MFWFGLFLLSVFAAAAVLWGRKQYKSIADPMKSHVIRMAMVKGGADAVTDARREFGMRLDHSLESIHRVDEILAQLRDRDGISELERTSYAMRFGSYVGETIKGHLNADWGFVNPPVDPMTIPLVLPSGTHLYPVRWCQDNIAGADSDSILEEFEKIRGDTDH